jgi:hypothetical protein
MPKAYKFRIYPSAHQQQYFAGAFGCCRWFWNYSLNKSQVTYKETGKGLSRLAIQGMLPALKKEYPWLKDGAYSPKNEPGVPLAFRHEEEVGSGFNRLQYFFCIGCLIVIFKSLIKKTMLI